MAAVGMQPLVQPGDRHRRLALAEQLVEARPKQAERLFEIGDIHRPAAVIDRLQMAQIGARHLGRVGEPGQHGRRGEHRHPFVLPQRIEDRRHVEMRQHQLVSAFQYKGQGVEPGAVRQRRGGKVGVALVDRIDIGVVALAHEQQVAVAQHRALRSAGGARGVEQPGAVGRAADLGAQRLAVRHQRVIFGGAGRDHPIEAVDRAGEGRQRLHEAGGGDQQARARVLGDVLDLARMQPSVGRHRAQPGRPAAKQQFEKLAAIFERQQHPVAGREPTCPESSGNPGGAARQLAVIPGVMAVADRRLLRQPPRGVEQQCREVHFITLSLRDACKAPKHSRASWPLPI